MKNAILFLVAACMIVSTAADAQRGPRLDAPEPVISPEVTKDRMVTFRLRAPEAESVKVVISEIFRQVPGYNPE